MVQRQALRGIAWLALGPGCSLVLDVPDGRTCSEDADCKYTAGPGRCTAGRCVEALPDASDESSSSSGSSSSGGSPAECVRNGECAEDERCTGAGTCQTLLSAECTILQWPDPAARDDVVFLGSIYPTGEPFGALTRPLQNATKLAIDDFNATTSLQGDRKVAWIGCDSTAGIDAAVAAARHLVDAAEVPAIVGPLFSEDVLAVARDVAIEAGVLVMTPTATSSSISALEDDDLVWRTIAPDVYQVSALRDRAVVRAPARLLVLAKDDVYGNGMLEGLEDQLASVLPGVPVYTGVFPNPVGFASSEALLAAYGQVIAGAFEKLPETYDEPADHYTDVLVLGTSEVQPLVYAYVTAWSVVQTAPNTPPLPTFTVSHGGVPVLETIVRDIGVLPGTDPLVAVRALLLDRLQGVSPVTFDEENFASFNIRYRIAFNDDDALTSSALAYDAALAVLFAMTTVDGAAVPTGRDLATAMPRLMDPEGPTVSFSGSTLEFIATARDVLVMPGGSVDLRGVSGALDWDAAGDVRSDLFGWDLANIGSEGDVTPRLTPRRLYVLEAPPSTNGAWVDL